jgi:hypothetical protein
MRRMRLVGGRMILFGVLFASAMGLVTAWLWNALMPAVFGLPAISFWQALGLLVLSRLLFARPGFRGRGGRGMRFARGWKGLTDEERQRFQEAMGGCGQGSRASS